MNGKQTWYIVDGYRPPKEPHQCSYEGHECIMILNCNDVDANVLIDIYFEDREPVIGIPYTVPARRIRAFHTDDKDIFGELEIQVNMQYSMRIRSDVGVIIQYGRADVSQPNLAYMALIGHGE